jgi:hypothetical protein
MMDSDKGRTEKYIGQKGFEKSKKFQSKKTMMKYSSFKINFII